MAETDLPVEVREVPCKTEVGATEALRDDADLSGGVPESDMTSAEEQLCPVTFYDSEENTAWNGEALTTTVQELNEALSNENGHSPDARRVLDILSQLNADDVKRIDDAYAGIYGNSLRTEIQERIPADYRKAELILEGDYAAHAAYAFEQKDSGYLMMLMSTLPKTEIEQLKTDFNAQYGGQFGSFDQAVTDHILGDADKYLIRTVFDQGVENLTPQARADAAIGYMEELKKQPGFMKAGDFNIERFNLLMGGVHPEDIATRELLNSPEHAGFVADYKAYFQPGWGAGIPADERFQAAVDLLQDGRISVASLIRQNSYQGFETFGSLFNGGMKTANWDAIESALKGVDPVYRADYLAGKELAETVAQGDWGNLPFNQQRQVMYYDQLERAFKDRGDDVQEVVWRDLFLNGDKTLISELAELKRDNGNIDDFTHAIEGASATDWQLLQPVDGSPSEYMTAMQGVVASIQNPDIQARMRELVTAFAGTEHFDATEVRRDFLSTVKDNTDDQQEHRFEAIATALLQMSPEEAELYADPEHPEYRAEIDKVLFPENIVDFNFTSDPTEAAAVALSQQILDYVAEHGELPQLDEKMTFMKDVMEGKAVDQAVRTRVMNDYLGDEETSAKMQAVMDAMFTGIDIEGIDPRDYANYWYVFGLQGTNMNWQAAVRNGGVGVDGQIQSGEGLGEGEGFYADLLKSDSQSNQEYIDSLPPAERALFDYVKEQGDTMDLAAQARAFALGVPYAHDYRYFVDEFTNMPADKRAEFLETYKGLAPEGTSINFTDDLLAAAAAQDHVSADVLEVLAKIADRDMEVRLEDRIRLAFLSGEKDYQQFLPELEALKASGEGAYSLRTGYSQYGDVAGDLLGMIDHNEEDRVRYSELLKVGASDPRELMLAQYDAMDLSGWDTDGTREAMAAALSDKQHLLASYYAARENIPADVLAELDAQFYASVQANRDSKASAAALVDQAISWTVAITAIGAIPFSGGTSLMFTGGAMAISASRPFVMPSVLGEQMTEEQFNQQLATMGIELATLGIDVAAQAFIMYKGALQRPALSQALTKFADETITGTTENVARTAANKTILEAEFSVIDDPLIPRLTGPESVELPSGALSSTGKIDESLESLGYVDDVPQGPIIEDGIVVRTSDGRTIKGEIIEGASDAFDNAKVVSPTGAVDDLTPSFSSSVDEGKAVGALDEGQPSVPATIRDADAELPVVPRDADAELPVVPRDADAELPAGQAANATIEIPTIPELYNLGKPRALTAVDRSIPRLAALEDATAPITTNMMRIKPSMISTPFLVAAEGSDLTSFDPGIAPQEEEQEPQPNAELIEMATVRRGEGPWQTAERILAAAGGEYDVMEVRALAKAIKAVYAADSNNPDIAGLKVNHSFITEGNFDQLLDSVSNDAVRTALLSFAS